MAAAAPYVPYIIAAAGTAASYAGQQEQARDKRRILNQALDETDRTQKQGAQMVMDQAQKLSPVQRQQALADQEASTYAQARQDLAGRTAPDGVGAIIDTAGDAGNVSKDFVKAKADKALSEGNRLMDVAREAAKTRAPSGVLQREGQGFADLTGRLGSLYGSNRNLSNAAGLDAQNVDEPTYGKLGKIAQMVGSAWAMGGAGGAAGAGGGASSAWDSMGSPGQSDAAQFGKYARIRFNG